MTRPICVRSLNDQADGRGRIVAVDLVRVLVVDVGPTPEIDGFERLSRESRSSQGIEHAPKDIRVPARRISRIGSTAGHPDVEYGPLWRQGRFTRTGGEDLGSGLGDGDGA